MTNDLTQGRPAKLLLSFSLPVLIGNLFQQLYAMADTVIVGRTISAAALAAVGATSSISFLILGFVQGLTAGFTVITAQRFGANDAQGVRRSFATSILMSVAITIVVTAISVAATRPLLELMQTPPDIIDDAYRYIVTIFWGIGAAVFYNLISSIIRALGDSRTPLLFLMIASLLNILLDFLFILGFGMGVMGAGWATVLAQVISGLLCVLYIRKKMPALWLHKEDWAFSGRFAWNHLRVGLPMAFQFSITAIGCMAVQGALNTLGSLKVAAFTAANKIENLAITPLTALGVAMATYCAQNAGAGRFDRVREGVKRGLQIAAVCAVAATTACLLLGGPLTRFFVGDADPSIISDSQLYLYCNAPFYFILSLIFLFRNSIQGMGYGVAPMLAGAVELVMRAAAAIFLAGAVGYIGVCFASPIAWVGADLLLIPAYFVLRRRFLAARPPRPRRKEAA